MEITDLINIENAARSNSIARALNENKPDSEFNEVLRKAVDHSDKIGNHPNKTTGRVKDKKLMDVCTQMESIFVSKMLKTMRNTIPKSKFINGGFAEKIFEDMLYDEYAMSLSKNEKLGIAGMLYDELSGR